METISTRHLVRNEDLNHHGTLYAGRSAEWLMETGFMTAAEVLSTNSLVAVRVNELRYFAPVQSGEILKLEGRTVYAGNSSLIVFVSAWVKNRKVIEGYITFVHVDETGRAKPHGIVIQRATEEERILQKNVKRLITLDRR